MSWVRDAFCGLYRNWGRLADPSGALPYLRSSVLNGCRSVLRRRALGHRVGSVLVLTNLQPGTNATIVHDGRGTSIPWSRYIADAAW